MVKERSSKSGKGMREVTIVKPSPSGTKKPSVTKVLLKGNERVTQGGNIKRAKPRQASTKKNALK
jgi:RNA-binding protein